jgi:hypothetical protein
MPAGIPITVAIKMTDAIGWTLRWEQGEKTLYINDKPVTTAGAIRRLLDGTALLPDGTALLAVSLLRSLGGLA